MQVEMASGKTVSECAYITSQEADTEGISGFMFSCAANALSHAWKYGEELKKWRSEKGY